jgi:hypothetical protein
VVSLNFSSPVPEEESLWELAENADQVAAFSEAQRERRFRGAGSFHRPESAFTLTQECDHGWCSGDLKSREQVRRVGWTRHEIVLPDKSEVVRSRKPGIILFDKPCDKCIRAVDTQNGLGRERPLSAGRRSQRLRRAGDRVAPSRARPSKSRTTRPADIGGAPARAQNARPRECYPCE